MKRLPIAVVAALAVLMSTGGCSGPPPEEDRGSPTSTSARGTPAGDPETILKEQVTQLRSLIDEIGVKYPAKRNVSTGEGDRDCSDVSTTERWPRRWTSGRALSTDEGDAIQLAERIADHLSGLGWSRRDSQAGNDRASLTLQKDGFLIVLNSADRDVAGGGGGISLLAYSACVNADGTIDRRTVS